MELIILSLGGSIGAVLSQLLEIIAEERVTTLQSLSPPHGPDRQRKA